MLKLTFIADTHYYSRSLGTCGRQYFLRSGSDQKCLAESGDIIDSAFELIGESDADAVMIAGDLTNDGEVVCHKEFRSKLYELKKKKKVFVVTATHDWCCDGNPRRFNGSIVTHDVDTMKSHELADFYKDFGLSDSISSYITHIGTCSYVIQLSEKVRLLALNDDKNGNDHAGFTEEHFSWIEEQLRLAQADGCLVIGMMHHLLMPHISPLITGGSTCVENREYVASRLADAGLRYMFVGHSHIQSTADFKSKNGNVITEINIGSLTGYPAPIVNVTVNDDMTLSYEVEHLRQFKLDGKITDAQIFLKNHVLALIKRLLDSPNKDELRDRLDALQLDGKKISPLAPVILPLFKFIKTADVSKAYRKLRLLGLAKFVDKDLAIKFKNKKIIDFVNEITLSLFDGSVKKYTREDDYYKFVMSFISIPSKIMKNNLDTKKLIFAIDAILTGGKFDNQKDTI